MPYTFLKYIIRVILNVRQYTDLFLFPINFNLFRMFKADFI